MYAFYPVERKISLSYKPETLADLQTLVKSMESAALTIENADNGIMSVYISYSIESANNPDCVLTFYYRSDDPAKKLIHMD